jgi:hypothetical protein
MFQHKPLHARYNPAWSSLLLHQPILESSVFGKIKVLLQPRRVPGTFNVVVEEMVVLVRERRHSERRIIGSHVFCLQTQHIVRSNTILEFNILFESRASYCFGFGASLVMRLAESRVCGRIHAAKNAHRTVLVSKDQSTHCSCILC